MKTIVLILATFVLFSSLFTISEADALIESMSLEDLAKEAEFVVIGEVTEISPLVPGYLLPFTDGYDRFQFDVTLSVENDLDGKYGQDIIVFRIMDSREDFGMYTEDEQNFEIGERVLVFIGEKEPDSIMGDAYLVYGVTQGKYLLQDGIVYGTDFPEGIGEDELISKIKNIRLAESLSNSELQSEKEDDVDFRDASGEIICKGYSSGGNFFEYPKCGPIDQFVIRVLIIVLPVTGTIIGFIIWGKRK